MLSSWFSWVHRHLTSIMPFPYRFIMTQTLVVRGHPSSKYFIIYILSIISQICLDWILFQRVIMYLLCFFTLFWSICMSEFFFVRIGRRNRFRTFLILFSITLIIVCLLDLAFLKMTSLTDFSNSKLFLWFWFWLFTNTTFFPFLLLR
jgi:hypothetical protein